MEQGSGAVGGGALGRSHRCLRSISGNERQNRQGGRGGRISQGDDTGDFRPPWTAGFRNVPVCAHEVSSSSADGNREDKDMRRSNVALRLQTSLLEEAKRVAASEGVALNQLINVAVAEKISALRPAEYFNEPSARADINKAKRSLSRPGL